MSSYYRNEEFKQEVAKIAHQFGVLKRFLKTKEALKVSTPKYLKTAKLANIFI